MNQSTTYSVQWWCEPQHGGKNGFQLWMPYKEAVEKYKEMTDKPYVTHCHLNNDKTERVIRRYRRPPNLDDDF